MITKRAGVLEGSEYHDINLICQHAPNLIIILGDNDIVHELGMTLMSVPLTTKYLPSVQGNNVLANITHPHALALDPRLLPLSIHEHSVPQPQRVIAKKWTDACRLG